MRRAKHRPAQPDEGEDVFVGSPGRSPDADFAGPESAQRLGRAAEGGIPGRRLQAARAADERLHDAILGGHKLMDVPAPDAEPAPAYGMAGGREDAAHGAFLHLQKVAAARAAEVADARMVAHA